MFAMTWGTLIVFGLKMSLTSPVFWLVIVPLALAAGFWGPPLICEAAYRTRFVLVPLAAVGVVFMITRITT